ncbi:hypothetical protein RDWZM_004161 [Blomia tropicalis]|uniref:F-box domain-containing protein n=1 Tax=Blomia tropicalis TaxID=40697 RepID=A0A9Q0MGP1_BLOTA|nr:hypothetical protein RDWZM_004161 [Blomia tropicalis]
MNINELNDDCLIYIFEQLYCDELICQRVVCKRWRDTIEHKILNRKKSLKLFEQFFEIEDYYEEIECENAIETDCFKIEPNFSCQFDIVISDEEALDSTEIKNFLIRLFPLLEELVVYQKDTLMYYLHPFLIQTNHLTSLTLCGEIEDLEDSFPDSFIVPELLNVIYGLPQLKKLNILDLELTKKLTEEGMRRICPQLSQLSLAIEKFKPFFLRSLTSNCTYLRLDIANDTFNILKFLKENELPQLNRLSKLRIALSTNQYRTGFLNVICKKFIHLEYLDFSHCKMYPCLLFSFSNEKWTLDHHSINNLRKLTNLTELRLSHVLFNNQNGQLPTIERLHLSNLDTFNPEEFWPKVSHIFPNITELNSSEYSRMSDLSNYFSRLVSVKKIKNFNYYSDSEDDFKYYFNYGSDNDYNDFYDSDNEYF